MHFVIIRYTGFTFNSTEPSNGSRLSESKSEANVCRNTPLCLVGFYGANTALCSSADILAFLSLYIYNVKEAITKAFQLSRPLCI